VPGVRVVSHGFRNRQGPCVPCGETQQKTWKKTPGKNREPWGQGGKTTGKPGGNSKDCMDLRTQDLGEVQGGFFVLTVAKIMTFVGLCGGLHYSVILYRF